MRIEVVAIITATIMLTNLDINMTLVTRTMTTTKRSKIRTSKGNDCKVHSTRWGQERFMAFVLNHTGQKIKCSDEASDHTTDRGHTY